MRRALMLALMALAIIAAACGGGDGDDTESATTTSTDRGATSDADDGPDDVAGDDEPSTAAAASPSGQDSGSATLTIGEQTWAFDNYGCAFGYEATRSDEWVFSSTSFGEDPSGARVQMLVDINDDSGEERYQGDGVTYIITIDDISDFESPAVAYRASSGEGVFSTGPFTVEIDGDRVTAVANFDDESTEMEVEQIPGTFEGTCGNF